MLSIIDLPYYVESLNTVFRGCLHSSVDIISKVTESYSRFKYDTAEDTVREVSNVLKRNLHLTHLVSTCIDIAHRVGVYRKEDDRAAIARLKNQKAQTDFIGRAGP
ncbi:hypothetical protein ElyMa_005079500 [Elysia marginata]|uniref:Uncharacterized protein n=1 Tax=Elysia marginata TaxID=1093978 RepID=A0AAV4JGB1_9GAST|nr:hypothetical protein ElyMa_005079500 [Elysia marginata]